MLTVGVCERGIPIVPERESGPSAPTTERGKVIAFLTPPPSTVTGNPVIDRWIAEGRLLPAADPGTALDLLPLADPPADGSSLAEAVVATGIRRLARRDYLDSPAAAKPVQAEAESTALAVLTARATPAASPVHGQRPPVTTIAVVSGLCVMLGGDERQDQ